MIWSFNEDMNGITEAHIVQRAYPAIQCVRQRFNEGMNGISDAHIVWQAFNEGMNGIPHTTCVSVVAFIKQPKLAFYSYN